MAAKKGAPPFLFAIATIVASSRAFASIPRDRALEPPAIHRYALQVESQRLDDRASIDNARLLGRALARALPAPAPVESLSETRVWAFALGQSLLSQGASPLTRALHRASARSWPEIVSDRTVLSPDPLGYTDS